MLGEGQRRKGDGRHEVAAALQRLQGGPVLEQARWHDGGEPAAGRQAIEGGVQMPLQVLERRIDEGGVEAAGERQEVLQMHRVVPRRRGVREQPFEQGRAMRRELVERQVRAAGFCDDRHQSGARRGLEHAVARPHLGGGHGHRRERRRR